MTIVEREGHLQQWARDSFFVVRGLFSEAEGSALIDATVEIVRRPPDPPDAWHRSSASTAGSRR